MININVLCGGLEGKGMGGAEVGGQGGSIIIFFFFMF